MSRLTVHDCIERLEQWAPPELAESWDNVGLLIGARPAAVRRLLTCLSLTPDVAREAVDAGVDLIVTHHPVLFRAVQRLTDETIEGAMLLELIRSRVSVYSSHTAYDSAAEGINQQLAEGLGLVDVAPLRARVPLSRERTSAEQAQRPLGAGRYGRLMSPIPLSQLLDETRSILNAAAFQFVGDPQRLIQTIAIACGSAGEFLPDAIRLGCDLFITGEARFHTGLEARAAGIALVLAGHYATERPGMESLAERIAQEWPGVEAWASRVESDPFQWTTA
jgi:dinuclear metal center YbgI/SA1388 family protein